MGDRESSMMCSSWWQWGMPAVLCLMALSSSANAVSFARTDEGFKSFKDWYWNDVKGVRQCNSHSTYAQGCNDMTTGDKASALQQNWDSSDLLEFMQAAKRHAKGHTWQEGPYTYSFCKFYQRDLREVTQFLENAVEPETKQNLADQTGQKPEVKTEGINTDHRRASGGWLTWFRRQLDPIVGKEPLWESASTGQVAIGYARLACVIIPCNYIQSVF